MSEQYDSLSEKTKRIEHSLKYTNGDMDKAKSMAAGQYNDIIAVKGKFAIPSSGQSGMFFAFFNIYDEYIAYVDTVLSGNSSIFDKVRVFDDWKSLNDDLSAYKDGGDAIDSQGFTDFLLDSLIGYDVFPDVQNGNLDDLTRTINEILVKSFNEKGLQCQVELETTNSLALDMAGIGIDLPSDMEETDSSGGEAASGELSEFDRRIAEIEGEANYIIGGEVVVSPVKGKYINDLNESEKIMVMLTDNDAVTEKILSVLKAKNEDGHVSPVKGRLRAKIPMEKSGHMLYALVAKGVLAKIIEEENVKVKMDSPSQQEEEKKPTGDKKIVLLVALLLGLILVAVFILMMVL
ncbi:MAG: hypothetical protein GY754_31885 [bacterium]|nr:hypothetical protein [bacterium]